MYCLFTENNWWRLNSSFLTFRGGGGGVKMCDKMAISTYIMKIAENDPFLRLQMRAIEMFNRHHCNLFSSNKQYVEIELMKNETNRWSIFLVKAKYWYIDRNEEMIKMWKLW